MRKLLFFIPIALAFLSCNKETPIDYVVISGQVENNGFPKIIIESIDHTFEKTIELNNEREFSDTLKIQRSGTYRFNQRIVVQLEKGYNLQINYDAKNPNTSVVFSGNGSAFNQYMLKKREKTLKMEGDFASYYSLKRKSFRQKTQEIKSAQEELLKTVVNITEDLRNKEKRNIHYAYLINLNQYPMAHASFLQLNEQPEAYEDVINELRNLDLNDEADYSHSAYYNNFVFYHHESLISKKLNQNSSDSIETLNEIPSELIRNSLLYSIAKRNIRSAENVEGYYKNFMKLATNDSHKAEITKIHQKPKEVLLGQPSPEFINYENHTGGHTSLSDLKGKYVLIDVWATWCKPCLEEIPALKKLEVEYNGKSIEFVSISVDRRDQYERWKKMVSDKVLGGIQLIADNSFESDFIRSYNINAIPRFILIDPDGNVINANAPMPSNNDLTLLLEDLNL